MVGTVKKTQYNVVNCVDGNAGAVVQACTLDSQFCDPATGNGKCAP